MLYQRLAPDDTLNSYNNFHVNFWIDRFLICINVIPPLLVGIILGVYHVVQDIARCNFPARLFTVDQFGFLNRFCSLQLATQVLQGTTEFGISEHRDQGSLQHEYYPFLLVISSFIFWLPHAIWTRAVNRASRRDLTLIRNELRNFRETAMRELNRRGEDSEMNLVDFTASVSDLPHLHACQINWSLTHYLSVWQSSDYYWRRYLAKHSVLLLLQSCAFLFVLGVLCAHSGAPFGAFFLCQLPPALTYNSQSGSSQVARVQCVLKSTFLVNISTLLLYLCNIIGLITQIAYFYSNYTQYKYSFREQRYFDHSFFGSYIRLMAYSQFRRDELERLRGLHISLEPGFLRSDFHYLSLLATENQGALTDVFHVHYWTERFVRAIRARKLGYLKSNRLRRSSCGLSRSEDVSLKLNFEKMKLKVEINDLFL